MVNEGDRVTVSREEEVATLREKISEAYDAALALHMRVGRMMDVVAACKKDEAIPAYKSFRQYLHNELRVARKDIRDVVVQELKKHVVKGVFEGMHLDTVGVAKSAMRIHAKHLMEVIEDE